MEINYILIGREEINLLIAKNMIFQKIQENLFRKARLQNRSEINKDQQYFGMLATNMQKPKLKTQLDL